MLLYELLTSTTPLTREVLNKAAIDELLRRIREEGNQIRVPSLRQHKISDFSRIVFMTKIMTQ